MQSHGRVAYTCHGGWVPLLRRFHLMASRVSGEEAADSEGFRFPGFIAPQERDHVQAVTRGAVDDLARRYAGVDACEDALYFGDKLISLDDFAFTREIWPDAHYLWIVRDFRDVLISSVASTMLGHGHAMASDAPVEDRWNWIARWIDHIGSIAEGDDHFQLVRYENLIQDPRGVLGPVLERLGLDVDDGLASFLDGGSGELFSVHGTTSSPTESIARWKRDLPAEHLQVANQILGSHLEAHGYA